MLHGETSEQELIRLDVTVPVINNSSEVPSDYSLSQNYPNPFNPSTNITYTIAKDGFVSVKVYNMLGKEIDNLVSGYQIAGIYNVTYNAKKITSGLYFYQLSVNGYTDTKKFMVVK